MEETPQRFNPDGECRANCIDFITFSLRKNIFCKEEISAIYDTVDTVKFLKKYNFSFFISLPLVSLFSAKGFYLLKHYRRNIILKSSFFSKMRQLNNTNYCVLYHHTALQLYNLKNQKWSHCVVLANSNTDKKQLYDPLLEILQRDGEIVDVKRALDIDRFNKLTGIRILIW